MLRTLYYKYSRRESAGQWIRRSRRLPELHGPLPFAEHAGSGSRIARYCCSELARRRIPEESHPGGCSFLTTPIGRDQKDRCACRHPFVCPAALLDFPLFVLKSNALGRKSCQLCRPRLAGDLTLESQIAKLQSSTAVLRSPAHLETFLDQRVCLCQSAVRACERYFSLWLS